MLTIIGAVIAILLSVGSWKQGVEDHLKNQDEHVRSQDQTMKALAKALERENDKLDNLKDGMNSVDKRLINVEDWMRMNVANQYNRKK